MTQVSILAVRALAAAAERAGARRDEFLAEAGLTAAQLDDASARISLASYGRVRRAALVSSNDPALGLHMGGQASTDRYDVLASLAEQSSALRDALQTVSRYTRIVMDGPELTVVEHGDSATIRFTVPAGEPAEERLTTEFVSSSLLYLVRRFVGDDARPRCVAFPYDAPDYRHEYTRVFAGSERFQQAYSGLEIERGWLDSARTYRSAELHALLQKRADQLLARVEQEASAADRVKRCLASQDLQIRPSMDAIARELGMSARSLRRRLHGEQQPYSELVEDARAGRAKLMLADPRQSVQETAYALGFETPAAFSRAFKRWTGVAPSLYRAQHPHGRARSI